MTVLQKPAKILIIQTAFIGDVILTTPLVSALHKIYPDSKIDFLTIPKSVNILESNPAIHTVLVFDKRDKDRGWGGLKRTAERLKNVQYDICITPHRSLRSAYLTFRSKAGIRIGFDRSAWKYGFTDVVTYPYEAHEIERNLKLLVPLGHSIPISRPEIYPDEQDELHVKNVLIENDLLNDTSMFALAPGSVWPTKRWPEDYYAKISDMLTEREITPLLIGGIEDVDLCDKISKFCSGAHNLAGKFTLRQTVALLAKCKVF